MSNQMRQRAKAIARQVHEGRYIMRSSKLMFTCVFLVCTLPNTGHASFKVCNNTSIQTVFVSVGTLNKKQLRKTSKGWAVVRKGKCKTVLSGKLEPGKNRYYYYAEWPRTKRYWTGNYQFCVIYPHNVNFDLRTKRQSVTGSRCSPKNRRAFRQVDVKGKNHTVNLILTGSRFDNCCGDLDPARCDC